MIDKTLIGDRTSE